MNKEIGIQYFGVRYIKNEIGRFLTPDPIGPVNPWNSKTNYEMLLNPQRLNPYAYGLNNPYRYIDPNGKAAVDLRGYYSFRQQVAERYLNWAPSWLQDVLMPVDPTIGPMAIESGGGKLVGRGLGKGAEAMENALRSGQFTIGQLRQFERQLAEHGVTSLKDSLATFERRLAEHQQKLVDIRKAGGYTSSVEREIRNYQQQINAVKEVLKKDEL